MNLQTIRIETDIARDSSLRLVDLANMSKTATTPNEARTIEIAKDASELMHRAYLELKDVTVAKLTDEVKQAIDDIRRMFAQTRAQELSEHQELALQSLEADLVLFEREFPNVSKPNSEGFKKIALNCHRVTLGRDL